MSDFESLHSGALGTEQWLSWEEDLGRLQGTNVYFLSPQFLAAIRNISSVGSDIFF